MPKRIGKYTIQMENSPKIKGYAAVCGKKEAEGPLGKFFDKTFEDARMGEKSWEKAESKLQSEAANLAIKKANLNTDDINLIFAGDLLNQCISSTFGIKNLNIPFLGQYGACSTMAQTLVMSSLMVDCHAANNCLAVTSSHFCSAERQFRFPLEYGGQRTPSAQWTVTGSGAAIVGDSVNDLPRISSVTIGRITDLGVKDSNNMGAAMAPAAARTLKDFFDDTSTRPNDYDLILTGDLGEVGSKLMKNLLRQENIEINNHKDCGLLIYDQKKQDVHAGGSGCGCSAVVLCSVILNKLINKKLNNILFMATGALMSPTSTKQGESIPSIAHLVHIVS